MVSWVFLLIINIYIYIYKERERERERRIDIYIKGDQKAPFLIATTLRYREGAAPFTGLPHFTLDTYPVLLSVKQGGIKYHF